MLNITNEEYSENESYKRFIFTSDGKTLGTFGVNFNSARNSCFVHSFGIIGKKNRNKGYGTQMMMEFLSTYANDKDVHLQVLIDNEPAIRLYQKAGFQIMNPGSTYCYMMKRPNPTLHVV